MTATPEQLHEEVKAALRHLRLASSMANGMSQDVIAKALQQLADATLAVSKDSFKLMFD